MPLTACFNVSCMCSPANWGSRYFLKYFFFLCPSLPFLESIMLHSGVPEELGSNLDLQHHGGVWRGRSGYQKSNGSKFKTSLPLYTQKGRAGITPSYDEVGLQSCCYGHYFDSVPFPVDTTDLLHYYCLPDLLKFSVLCLFRDIKL